MRLRRAIGCLLIVIMVLGVAHVPFPSTPVDVTVELFYDGVWNNETAYVYTRDKITITRGYQPNGANCDPGTAKLTVNNRDARFSPDHPNSALFGKIGRNTPIRISVTYDSVTYTRFVGEVTAWPSEWDLSGKDVYVPLEAAGVLRRISKGRNKKPLASPLARTVPTRSPAAYWPLEDVDGSQEAVSGLVGGRPMVKAGGLPDFGAERNLDGAAPVAHFDAETGLAAGIPANASSIWYAMVAIKAEESPAGLPRFIRFNTPTGSVNKSFELLLIASAPDSLTLQGLDASGAGTGSVASVTFDGSGNAPSQEEFYGRWWFVSMLHYQSGGSVVTMLAMSGDGVNFTPFTGSGIAGTAGPLTSVVIQGGQEGKVAFGHFGVWTSGTSSTWINDTRAIGPAFAGYTNQVAAERWAQMCTLAGFPYVVSSTPSALMGPERPGTVVQGLQDAIDTDGALMFEQRDAIGLRMRTARSRMNQVPVALSYTAGHISEPFRPVPDDQAIVNNRRVKGRKGGLGQFVKTSGPLNVNDPSTDPQGIGEYDDEVTRDLYYTEQLEQKAAWDVHTLSWDAPRYPQVHVDFAAANNVSLIPTLVPKDTGDLLTVSDLPAWLRPVDAELEIAGYREVFGAYDWDMWFNCWPGGPYRDVGVWALMGQTLHADITSSATTADIATSSGPVLSTTDDAGYLVTIGGEDIQITDVAPSTITYGSVGTVSHNTNASVTPGLPGSLAQGNLMVMLAAIRNSGAGIPSTPAGWYRFPVFPATANVQLFGKIAGASESGPTVSFTGGVANATTSAQIIRLAGKWHDVTKLMIGGAHSLNAAAQNITVPGLKKPEEDRAVLIVVGWKQDDSTTAANPPGTSTIAAESTTTGDDQTISWGRTIQTTAAAFETTSFTVTGGASAISRAAVLALRCDYQTATVVRSVNNITAAHSAGAAVTATRPMRFGI